MEAGAVRSGVSVTSAPASSSPSAVRTMPVTGTVESAVACAPTGAGRSDDEAASAARMTSAREASAIGVARGEGWVGGTAAPPVAGLS